MKLLTIILGKLSIKLLSLMGRNGSALPGLIVEKLYPKLLQKQLNQLEGGVIVVTGTNGKTTTTKSLVFLLEQCGYKVLTNPTGSNFTRGIYATLLKYSNIFGGLEYDIAVLELDEAYSRIFAKQFSPKYVLALNVMRDQLDRYGEIDTTAQMIGETIGYATEGVVLNLDDKRVKALSADAKSKVSYFSVSPELQHHLPGDDEMHGPKKKHPKRAKKSHANEKSASSVVLSDYRPGSVGFRVGGKLYRSKLKVAGIHNASNLAAALAVAMRVCPQMEPQFIVPTMEHIPAAFGRGEVIRVGDTSITVALVKNPSGFRQSLASYDTHQFQAVGYVVNDDFADGRDVSWLWDVDFSGVNTKSQNYASGIRGSDMAIRLKYDGIKSELVESRKEMLDRILSDNPKDVLIFCTYTSMLEIRSALASITKVEDIW